MSPRARLCSVIWEQLSLQETDNFLRIIPPWCTMKNFNTLHTAVVDLYSDEWREVDCQNRTNSNRISLDSPRNIFLITVKHSIESRMLQMDRWKWLCWIGRICISLPVNGRTVNFVKYTGWCTGSQKSETCIFYARIVMSVEPHIQYSPNQFFALFYTYGRGLVRIWRRCNTLCTSCLVNDVIFFH